MACIGSVKGVVFEYSIEHPMIKEEASEGEEEDNNQTQHPLTLAPTLLVSHYHRNQLREPSFFLFHPGKQKKAPLNGLINFVGAIVAATTTTR